MKGRALALGLAILALPALAHADPDRKTCLTAVDDGQKLRDDGKLADAKKQFLTCASKACGAAVSKQCDEWFDEVEKDQPTVLFRALDAKGRELVDVHVFVDGTKVSDTISGQPLVLDPREHTLRFERGGDVAEEKFVLRVSEKNRLIELRFAPAPAVLPAPVERAAPPPVAAAPPPSPSKFRVPLLAYVGGGVFVAGAATTVIFAVLAHSKESDLRSSCAPRCTEDDRDAVKSRLVVANVGLFVGLAGLGLAAVTTVLANRHHDADADQKTGSTGVHIVAGPTGFAGTF